MQTECVQLVTTRHAQCWYRFDSHGAFNNFFRADYIEKDQIEPCYQYLLLRLHQTNTFLYSTIRDGSAHSQNGFGEYLRRFLPVFKETNWRLRLRVDSGFFSEEAIDVCTDNKAFIFVKAPMSDARKEQARIPNIVWTADANDARVSWGMYKTVTEKRAEYREVYKRTEYFEPGALFSDVRYDAVATNDMTMPLPQVFSHYNGRANIENNIKELKYDYKLGKIVTQSFDVNDIITQTTIMAHILIQHFKRIVLDKDDRKIQLSTLRWRVLNLPTYTVRGARRTWYRIKNAFMDSLYFLRMLRRLLTKPSFLIRPPDLLITA